MSKRKRTSAQDDATAPAREFASEALKPAVVCGAIGSGIVGLVGLVFANPDTVVMVQFFVSAALFLYGAGALLYILFRALRWKRLQIAGPAVAVVALAFFVWHHWRPFPLFVPRLRASDEHVTVQLSDAANPGNEEYPTVSRMKREVWGPWHYGPVQKLPIYFRVARQRVLVSAVFSYNGMTIGFEDSYPTNLDDRFHVKKVASGIEVAAEDGKVCCQIYYGYANHLMILGSFKTSSGEVVSFGETNRGLFAVESVGLTPLAQKSY